MEEGEESVSYLITGIQTEEHQPKYIEPWVSYVRNNEENDFPVQYNKMFNINFEPIGDFTRSDFGVTQDMVDKWVKMCEKETPPDLYGIKVMSCPISRINVFPDCVDFGSLSGTYRAGIYFDSDSIIISTGDTEK
jgi:hypothetical protein